MLHTGDPLHLGTVTVGATPYPITAGMPGAPQPHCSPLVQPAAKVPYSWRNISTGAVAEAQSLPSCTIYYFHTRLRSPWLDVGRGIPEVPL